MAKKRRNPGAVVAARGADGKFVRLDPSTVSSKQPDVNPPRWPWFDDGGFPVVYCAHVGKDLRFWCPYCNHEHTHGSAGGDGHRGSHCHSEAARKVFARGYVLRVVDWGGE